MFFDKYLDEITKRYMLTRNDYKRETAFIKKKHPELQQKMMDIKQEVEEGNYTLTGEPKVLKQQPLKVFGKQTGKLMDKELALKLHLKLHELSIKHMREIKNDQINMEVRLKLMSQTLADRFYMATGIESKDLDINTEVLGLEKDEDYKKMCAAYA